MQNYNRKNLNTEDTWIFIYEKFIVPVGTQQFFFYSRARLQLIRANIESLEIDRDRENNIYIFI